MMKRITILTVLFVICSLMNQIYAQSVTDSVSSNKRNYGLAAKDSLMIEYLDAFVAQLREPEYKLYPTQNMWTFLKLNTRTGQIWQVQYSVGEGSRLECVLDDNYRIGLFDDNICGRFELYETKNMYNFILLDNISGRCWQVQWHTEAENRGVLRIY